MQILADLIGHHEIVAKRRRDMRCQHIRACTRRLNRFRSDGIEHDRLLLHREKNPRIGRQPMLRSCLAYHYNPRASSIARSDRAAYSAGSSTQVPEVDLKLIELAKRYDAKIVTNDYNLNKVATLRRDLDVLNVNQLANALKPVVLPG